MSDICPNCGEENGALGQHWPSSRCEYPNLSDKQKDIITGVLMSDGYINRRKNRKPRLKVDSTNKEYLNYLNKEFGAFSTGKPTCYRTAEEEAKREKIPRFKNSTYQDQYTWTSRSLPELNRWANWYSSGEKIWPKNINLTPTVLKHFYVGDGTMKNGNCITIYLSNEKENKRKVNKYFTDVGLPKPRWYNQERRDGSISARIRWRVEESKEILEYMGEPISGHEYKW